MPWFRKQVSALEMSAGVDELFDQILRRKHWNKIDPEVIKAILDNSHNEIFDKPGWDAELIRIFVFISEECHLLENNFLKIARTNAGDIGMILFCFSVTLSRLGSQFAQSAHDAAAYEQAEYLAMMADMAFTSSILCDPFQLPAYGGMAILHGYTLRNKDVGLEWCSNYKKAEDNLLNTPDAELNFGQLAMKKMLDPDQAAEVQKLMAEKAPHLLPDIAAANHKSMRDIISELERHLLSS